MDGAPQDQASSLCFADLKRDQQDSLERKENSHASLLFHALALALALVHHFKVGQIIFPVTHVCVCVCRRGRGVCVWGGGGGAQPNLCL